MKKILSFSCFILLFVTASAQSIWPAQSAASWYSKQPWLVGCNYIPANSINELEMWQADTFDPAQIEKELAWAESIGMNTLRVFLHDLLWTQDAEGFKKRIEQFLVICEKHHIHPMFVLFDSCWDPLPKTGKQREPKPGIHNSGWLQSPGAAMQDEKNYPRFEAYVKGVVGTFANDPRVLCWDIWNEPDNFNTNSYGEPKNKIEYVQKLLPLAFAWAREMKPLQPLTSGVWHLKADGDLNALEKIQLAESDVLSFHNYGDAPDFKKYVAALTSYNRPLICTEWLARGNKSTVEAILPVGKEEHVGMLNWGFVVGKTQTNLPWDSWQKPYVNGREPAVWHHEIFRADGTPYSEAEVALFKNLTAGNRRY